MPEGDTLFNTALALRPALLGESLTAVNIRARGMYRLRVGDTVRSVEAVGKFLEIVVERGLALRTHLHMTGVWHLYEQGERWRRPRHLARAVLETESHVAVCFAAPTVEVGPAADDRLAHLGPDLCHADVDLDAVLERVAGSDSSTEIAEVLLDQRLAAGIGNVYKNEVLWACEVSPFRSLADAASSSSRSCSACGRSSSKQGTVALAAPLRQHAALVRLVLHENKIGDEGVSGMGVCCPSSSSSTFLTRRSPMRSACHRA